MSAHKNVAARVECHKQEETVLLHKRHPIGGAFVAIRSDGSIRAGYTETRTRVYRSAREAFDYFNEVYENLDHYGSGNICNALCGRGLVKV